MLTPRQKKIVDKIKKDPDLRKAMAGKTDEEILAAYRFVEDGKGIQVYDNEEAYRKARKKRSIDEIEEV